MSKTTFDGLNRFVAVYNDVAGYPTIADVADALGLSVSRTKSKASEIRRLNADGVAGLNPIITRGAPVAAIDAASLLPGQKLDAQTGRPVPLSEFERKFKPGWTAEDCIAHLRDIVGAGGSEEALHLSITRNQFRNASDISDSTWNRYFGTFEEFRRQAGLQLSRHAHNLEKQIAKHASKDAMAELSRVKRGYEGRYERSFSDRQRFRTILAGSDFHGRMCDPFVLRLFYEANRRIQPDVICLNGDIFDFAEFSRWTNDPRDYGLGEELDIVHGMFARLREDNPDAQLDFIEGNHEYRLFRHLSESSIGMKVVLDKLHGMDIPKLLQMDLYEINFTGRASLKAFRERDIRQELERNFKVYWDAVLACHYPDRRNLRIPGFGGHHHKHEVWPFFNPVYGACEFHQMGGGHRRSADYCDGEIWQNGFLIVHVDTQTKSSVFEYVPITDFAVLGGVYYHRAEDEQVPRAR